MKTATATVSAETTAIAHTGRGFRLQPGIYEVVDIDGADGVTYVRGPEGGDLVCASNYDSHIQFGESA